MVSLSSIEVVLLVCSILVSGASAFVVSPNQQQQQPPTCKSRLFLWFPDEGMEVARKTFGWWLMGAAGSGGAARTTFPNIYREYMELQELKGSNGSSNNNKDGPTLGIGQGLGFPEDVSVADVEQIVNNPLTVEEITQQFPVENNFLAAKGYLTYSAFSLANADANPLAVRAVFDSFRKPKCVEPHVAQQLLNEYKQDPTQIRQNLIIKQATLVMAASSLLFLLGLADLATASDFYRGWFPDWPGGTDFPRMCSHPKEVSPPFQITFCGIFHRVD
ncbi:expressed unknown protein [Seminavis robusta]|uniref:Uncharacterized protein n=1 Tax=Seminavis robusta TaxID=568900 RepID=A0A9N8F209_9STRA|nr:expressed unknown protein [Seminavis robusta]|eukprot:Sro2630_g333100.1 n/a (275) ;mRNA; r:4727-5551